MAKYCLDFGHVFNIHDFKILRTNKGKRLILLELETQKALKLNKHIVNEQMEFGRNSSVFQLALILM